MPQGVARPRIPPPLSAEETEQLSQDFDCGPPCVIGTMQTEDELKRRVDELFQRFQPRWKRNVNVRKRTRRDIWRYVLVLELILERARIRADYAEMRSVAKELITVALAVNEFRKPPRVSAEPAPKRVPKVIAAAPAAPEPPPPEPTPDDGLPQGDVSLLSDEDLEKFRERYGDIVELATTKPKGEA